MTKYQKEGLISIIKERIYSGRIKFKKNKTLNELRAFCAENKTCPNVNVLERWVDEDVEKPIPRSSLLCSMSDLMEQSECEKLTDKEKLEYIERWICNGASRQRSNKLSDIILGRKGL